MFIFVAIAGGLWTLALLASARQSLICLPDAKDVVPPYALVLPSNGTAPELEPPPRAIYREEVPPEGPEFVLFLDPSLRIPAQLPGRLAACERDLVSVFPHPNSTLGSQVAERLIRDFSGPLAVNNILSAAAFADPRCTWVHRRLLQLPGPEHGAAMRAARAAKAFGQALELRQDPTLSVKDEAGAYQPNFSDWFTPAPWLKWALALWLIFGNVVPIIGATNDVTQPFSILVLTVAFSARLMTAIREGFGLRLAAAGFVTEPLLGLRLLGVQVSSVKVEFPILSGEDHMETGRHEPDGKAWLDGSAVAYLARRTGGSARVMAQIYNNLPAGRTPVGLLIDRYIHTLPAARALRFRLFKTVELGRRIAPQRVLSIPSGEGRDALALGAALTCLVDPDPWALADVRTDDPSVSAIRGHFDALPEQTFDLILFIGLVEYLGDGELRRHLSKLKARLERHGTLLISSTQSNEAIGRMRRSLGWMTRGRSPDDIVHLLEETGFRIETRSSDPHELQWLFVAYPVWENDEFV